MQQELALVQDGQAAVQALVDLNDRPRMAEAIAPGQQLQDLEAGAAQGACRRRSRARARV